MGTHGQCDTFRSVATNTRLLKVLNISVPAQQSHYIPQYSYLQSATDWSDQTLFEPLKRWVIPSVFMLISTLLIRSEDNIARGIIEFEGANKNVHGNIVRRHINLNYIHSAVIVSGIYSMCTLLGPIELSIGVIALLSTYSHKIKHLLA